MVERKKSKQQKSKSKIGSKAQKKATKRKKTPKSSPRSTFKAHQQKKNIAKSSKPAKNKGDGVFQSGVRADQWNAAFGWQVLRRAPTYIADHKPAYEAAKTAANSGNVVLKHIVEAIERDLSIQRLIEAERASLPLASKIQRSTFDLIQHQMMVIQMESLTLSQLLTSEGDPLQYNDNEPWKTFIDRYPWDNSIPELQQWQKDWGHIMAFPVPAELNLVAPYILNRFWRYRASALVYWKSDASNSNCSFDGIPIMEFASATEDRPLNRIQQVIHRYHLDFTNQKICSEYIEQLLVVLNQAREERGMHPKNPDAKATHRDENHYSYFITWDMFVESLRKDSSAAEDAVAKDIWPDTYNNATENEVKQARSTKATDRRVGNHLDSVRSWITTLVPECLHRVSFTENSTEYIIAKALKKKEIIKKNAKATSTNGSQLLKKATRMS